MAKQVVGTIVVAGVLTVLACCWAFAEDWPQWRGPNRDAVSAEEGLLQSWPAGGPAELWSLKTPGAGYAAPSVVGGTIYITGSHGSKQDRKGDFYAVSGAGKLLWKLTYGREWGSNYDSSRTAPTIVDDAAYIISGMGDVHCIDLKTRTVRWSVDTMARFAGKNVRWGIAESPLVVDGKVICHPGGQDASVAALDAGTGRTVWQTKGLSDKSSYCSPILLTFGTKRQVVTQTDANIVGIDVMTGKVAWRVAHRNKYGVHPNTAVSVGGGKVFVSSGYGYGSDMLQVAANGESAKIIWHTGEPDNHFQGVLLEGGLLYGSKGRGELVCVKPANGDVAYRVPEVKKGAILHADNRLYSYSEKGGGVHLLDVRADGYDVKGAFKISKGGGPHWAHPVVSGGALYVRHGDMLMAYDIKAK